MDQKNVLVTGIGGNVGQGIIRNIRASTHDIRIIGTNIEDFSAGNHLCDVFYKVAYAYDESYLEAMQKIVQKEAIDLIIPSTDYEVYYLAKYQNEINCEVVVSSFETASQYLDKLDTHKFFKAHNIPFAASFSPSQYSGGFSDCIAKPRKGRGSRGLVINPIDYGSFSDSDYMIQEFHKGTEITTAFYVDKNQKLHGFITLERILENGTTTQCKVVSTYDSMIEPMLLDIIEVSEIKGSANVQSIVTAAGDIIPFEVNCRISGTNSIRANFGFKDVEYTLEEWLYNEKPASPQIIKGIATRILMDVIYTENEDFKDAKDNSCNHYLY